MRQDNQKVVLAIVINAMNLDHHLWENHGTWWIDFTVHLPDYTKQRIRFSLKTKSVEEARAKRDALFRQMAERGCLPAPDPEPALAA